MQLNGVAITGNLGSILHALILHVLTMLNFGFSEWHISFLLANYDNQGSFTPQKICKASNNQIELLPDTISIFWKTHLREVDISENVLKELPSYIFELEVRKCAEIARIKIRYNILTKEITHVSGCCTL